LIFGLTRKIEIAKRFSSHWPAMSLIPSESYSFPDHFTITRAASRKANNVEPEPEPEPVEPPPPKKPTIVALPNPKPQPAPPPIINENPEPVRKVAPPVQNPALRRASAPPPRIPEAPVRKIALPPTLKPKVRWNNRAPAMDSTAPSANNGNGNGAQQIAHEPPPARNVIQMKAPRPPQVMPSPENFVRPQPRPAPQPEDFGPQNLDPVAPPRPVPAPRPAPMAAKPVQAPPISRTPGPAPVSNPQTDFFEAFAQNNEYSVSKRRHKAKMRRFIFCEGIAVGVLLPLAILGIIFHPQNAALHWIMNILTISAAVAAALIPIIFFAATPTLPEIER
jgi:hypothetical protein